RFVLDLGISDVPGRALASCDVRDFALGAREFRLTGAPLTVIVGRGDLFEQIRTNAREYARPSTKRRVPRRPARGPRRSARRPNPPTEGRPVRARASRSGHAP